ncbi:uncharacterized protein LOC135959782 [Calliphora vicina]|uniref:uncharacterized protein LOC135959782 n=1 Tax=Calliphora vicina TaxID=7373 RepID=UPI00325AD3E0
MSVLDDFIRASDRVVEFQAYFETLPAEGHSVHSLEVHKDEIIRIWSEFRSSYDTILNKFTELESVNIESLKSRFFSTFEAHVKVLSRSNQLLDNLCQKTAPNNASESVTNTLPDSTHHITLPPCDTEIFHGDYQSWPTFRDMFTALYRNSKRLSPVEKMCHLLKKTQGEARELLKTCPITNDGFEMAWQNLVNRYENKRILINAQLKSLFNISPISKETGTNIRHIQRTINDCVTNLRLLQIDTGNWDIIFVYICSTCLPEVTLSLWEQSLPDRRELPTWNQMDSFLTARFQTLESVADIRTTFATTNSFNPVKSQNHRKSNSSDQKKLNSYSTSVNNDQSLKCSLCPDSHPLRLCPSFLKMSVEDRFATVKKQKRCTNCLGTSHEFKKCKSQYVCHMCRQKHHSLLHRMDVTHSNDQQKTVPPPVQDPTSIPNVNSNNVRGNDTSQIFNLDTTPSTSTQAAERIRQSYATKIQSTPHSTVILGTALVDVYTDDLKCTVRALIDSASEATFVSKKLQKKLFLKTRSIQTDVHGLNDALTATSTHLCHIRIGSPIDKSFKTYADAFVVKKLTGQLPYHSLSTLKNSTFNDLQMADTHLSKCSEIDLLLGGDIYPKIIQNGLRWDHNQSLVAQKTVFGWIVTGKIETSTRLHSISSFYNELCLNNQLQRFWELEEVSHKHRLSDEDLHCENIYQSTTYRNEKGRFVVSLPFKREYPETLNIGPSRDIALSQFLRNEVRLAKDPQLKLEYDRVITEYSTLKQMTNVSPSVSNSMYYLPHHAVFKPDSTTTKLRVVFNASSPSKNGISLNDLLHPGPILQADLTILILRWRLFRYVFNADIEKMYRQILVNPSHTPFQRIIHRSSPQEEPMDFELNTVTFGVNCAPYLAIRTLLELAKECETTSPTVSDILRNCMYVDDVLAGAHTLSLALKYRDELIAVLESAGFSLRKWTANNDHLLKGISSDHLLDDSTIVLAWLQKPPNKWKTFVENRVSSIIEKVGRESWYHVDSKSNPADLASRGITLSQLINNDLWWQGPSWLSRPHADWPAQSFNFVTEEETKPIHVHSNAYHMSRVSVLSPY